MTTKKLDAEPILRQLAEIRRAIPYLQPGLPPPGVDGRAPDLGGMLTEEDFEYATLADGVESLARELGAAIDPAYALAKAKALEIYYATEELARDPELIPHLARMREAYERDYGVAIPPKDQT
jgi:hypothetical protein